VGVFFTLTSLLPTELNGFSELDVHGVIRGIFVWVFGGITGAEKNS
jgi:hypothetical protein